MFYFLECDDFFYDEYLLDFLKYYEMDEKVIFQDLILFILKIFLFIILII